ncbi:TonB family protein [Undibacterium sp. RTI2.1]|uniref:TonB family protein n=1 Tax=unclassified Undibacterium TaxID=2630295 RepID=UPI002AB54B39|nr:MULTISPECIES: TonB family protein [unclassified Undibacterium]MDY7538717.1 TonB family protein [Undibacterium sp. 5I1]MEB0030227.1 TonB family protein [Undibacterium sp. RTI2.1]MEB0116851.1 TonB family protein [Undibacterium sp. RTI2.2]MEB0229656.1 TonB family protein [Undibacterium sp. 10I3]MEB0259105.1 TonB family protein [Undibacterium sp. 5I1]
MNLVTRQRETPKPDPVKKRLIAGVMISLLIHALILCVQFGVPGLGSPGAAAPEQNNFALATESELTIQIANPELNTSAAIPPLQVPQPPVSTPPVALAAETGIRLIATAVATPAAPVPTSSKPALAEAKAKNGPKKIVARAIPVMPKAEQEQSPEDPVRVIAQNEMRDDSFVVPLPSPEDPEHKPDPESRQKITKSVAPIAPDPMLDVASVASVSEQPDPAIQQAAARAEAAELAKLAEETKRTQLAKQQIRQQKQLKEEQARLQSEAQLAVQTPQNVAIQKLQEDNRKQADVSGAAEIASKLEEQKLAELKQAELKKIEQKNIEQQQAVQQLAQQVAQKISQDEAKRTQQELARLEQVRQREQAIQQERQQKQVAELQAQQQAIVQANKQAAEQAAEQTARQEAQRIAQQTAQREQESKQALTAQASTKFEPRTLPAIGNNNNHGESIASRADSGDRSGDKSGEGNGIKDGDRNGNGSEKGFVLPKNLFSSDLANKALEQSRGLGLLRGRPPVPIFGDDDKSRRRAVGSEYSKDVPLRMYVESWRQKIERNGSLNYSQISKDKARGYPVVSVIIRSDGSVEDIVLISSSGRADLDEAVRRIVRVNARYASFPANVAEKYDTIEIRRVWNFEEALRITEELR